MLNRQLLPHLGLILLCAVSAFAHATKPTFRLPLIQSAQATQPIELQQLTIGAEISGGLAETTVRMVFHNPNGRALEGNVQFPLLEGQQVSAFSLDIEGAMRPAVPVEKARGRAVFEEIARRGVDPALLETTQGNNFKLRVYPIPARGTRTVELKYTEALSRRTSQWAYRLPLAYGPVQDFSLTIRVHGNEALPAIAGLGGETLHFERKDKVHEATMSRQGFIAVGSIDILSEAPPAARVYRQDYSGASWFLAEIPVASTRSARPLPRILGLLWDSSGSGTGRTHDAEIAELDRYFRAMGKVEVRLTRLRNRPEPTQVFKVTDGDWSALRRALESTVYDGATALNDWPVQPDVDQYLMFSDGLSNFGSATAPRLSARQSLFTLNSSLSADTARLSAMARQARGRYIAVDRATPGAAADALLFDEARIEQLTATGATDLEVESNTVRGGLLRVAGRMLAPSGQLQLTLSNGAKLDTIAVPLDAAAPRHPIAASAWAGYRLRTLEADPELHRAEITRLGRRFGIPTRETSLIVLERMDDYVRYGIEPPEQYANAYRQLKQLRGGELARRRGKQIDDVVRMFERRTEWYNTDFSAARRTPAQKRDQQSPAAARPEQLGEVRPPPPPAPAPVVQTIIANATNVRSLAASAPALQKSLNTDGFAAGGGRAAAPAIGMALKKWVPNAPYIERLRAAAPANVYAVYLDQRPDYINSSAFFLDAADILLDKGERDLALRVLSNLAEMDLENRAVLRILGYRLLQADAPQLAVPVFEKVLRLAEEEPQSYRDLGLALAAAGKEQEAIDMLYTVVEKPWDGRFPEIENIVLAEINAIVAASSKKLDVSRIDPRLRANLPLDLRVVMTWDADNSDMDLWLTGPDGERCYYGNALTAAGGRMSRDFTGGYGPEEFSLRRASPGKYRIEANYYGNQQQVVAGATTLQVKLFTAFGTMRQKEKMITLRLKDKSETVFVGEFSL